MISTEAIKGMKMKASELIKELEKAIEEHGDLEVEHNERSRWDELILSKKSSFELGHYQE